MNSQRALYAVLVVSLLFLTLCLGAFAEDVRQATPTPFPARAGLAIAEKVISEAQSNIELVSVSLAGTAVMVTEKGQLHAVVTAWTYVFQNKATREGKLIRVDNKGNTEIKDPKDKESESLAVISKEWNIDIEEIEGIVKKIFPQLPLHSLYLNRQSIPLTLGMWSITSDNPSSTRDKYAWLCLLEESWDKDHQLVLIDPNDGTYELIQKSGSITSKRITEKR